MGYSLNTDLWTLLHNPHLKILNPKKKTNPCINLSSQLQRRLLFRGTDLTEQKNCLSPGFTSSLHLKKDSGPTVLCLPYILMRTRGQGR